MSTRARMCMLLIVTAVATPAGSASGAGWSAPVPIGGSEGRYPELAILGDGGAAALFMGGPVPLIPTTRPQVPVALSSRPAGGKFGAPVPLPPGYGQPIASSRSGMLIAVAGPQAPDDYFGGRGGPIVRLRIAIGKRGGALKRVRSRGAAGTRTLAAAVNDHGDAAVIYSRCRTRLCETTSIWAIFRRRGGSFSKPVALAGRNYRAAAAVVLNPAGDALLAWEHSNHATSSRTRDVETRLHKANGDFTPVRRAGSTAALPTIALTLTAHRTGTVAWFSEPVSEGSVGGAAVVAASRLMSNGRITPRTILDRFAPPATLNGANSVGGARLRAILDPDGKTTLAWTGHDNRYVVRGTRFPGNAEPQTLSPAGQNAELVDLAGDQSGDAAVIWIGGAQDPAATGTPAPGVGIAVRTGSTTAFAFPELALVNNSLRSYRTASVAIDNPGPRILVAASGEFALNLANPPPIVIAESFR